MAILPEMEKAETKGLVLEQMHSGSTTINNQKQTLVYKKYFLLCQSCSWHVSLIYLESLAAYPGRNIYAVLFAGQVE
jgi:hypothetical protein